jgi:2-dehydro-3-deoxyphosphogluconate aldolase / (4S)-4-hydroxy-2-oxoglutarate aldolase
MLRTAREDDRVIDRLIDDLRAHRVIATLRAPDEERARIAIEALVEGGIRLLEVTFTTPGADAVIAWSAATFGDDIVVGSGTVTTVEQARAAQEAGAAFQVSPGLDDAVHDEVLRLGGIAIPGAFTPTEVQRLQARSVPIVKIFPASVAGPGLLRALRGPFPDLLAVPTGGIAGDGAAAWFDAGALAVGAGSELIPAAALREGDRSALAASARDYLAALPARG